MRSLFITIVCSCIAFVSTANAELIEVSGNVSGTWSADTILVTGETTVPSGSSLSIDPGVLVLFGGHYKLIVDNGSFQAVGSESDSIIFTALHPGEGWFGLRFYDTDSTSCDLSYCDISRGRADGSGPNGCGGGIYSENSYLKLSHCTIRDCFAWSEYSNTGGGGMWIKDSSTAIIEYCHFDNDTCFWGYGGGIGVLYSTITFAHNVITNCKGKHGAGMYAGACNALIQNNLIQNNTTIYEAGPFTVEGDIGGIYCIGGNIELLYNQITGNYTKYIGGIEIVSCPAHVRGNIIKDNISTEYRAGINIMTYDSSEIVFERNVITGCEAPSIGAAGLYQPEGIFRQNIIKSNAADNYAGVYILFTGTVADTFKFYENILMGNEVYNNGATSGFYCDNEQYESSTFLLFHDNIVCDDFSSTACGIYLNDISATVYNNLIRSNSDGYSVWLVRELANTPEMNVFNNTIVDNYCEYEGSALKLNSDESIDFQFDNMLIWNNSIPAIGMDNTSTPYFDYCDIQDSLWPGMVNMSTDPMFVDPDLNEFRLSWGSPLIDAGNPDPTYFDPDGSIADIGAFYFDQTTPVRILLTPHETGQLIDGVGGLLEYTIRATNIDSVSHIANVWCNVNLPNGVDSAPLLGPVNVSIPPNTTVDRVRLQSIPAGAPIGVYQYQAFAVVEGDTSRDSFLFGKTGVAGIDNLNWLNNGESLADNFSTNNRSHSEKDCLMIDPHPNPFNTTTTITLQLQQAGKVKFSIYDVTGRLVTTLINGWRQAGPHEVTFDGSGLPSGIYFVRLKVSGEAPPTYGKKDYVAVRKMVLIK